MGGSLGDWSQMKLGMDQVWVSLVGGTGVTGEYNKVLQQKAKITEQNIQADSKYAEVNKQIAEENAKALEAKNKILKAEQEQQDKKDAEAKARREKELADIAAHEQAILDTQTAFRTAEDERKVVQEELDLAKQEADKALEIEFLTARLAELELIKLDAQIKEQVLEDDHYTALELRKKKHALEQKKTSEELAKEELAIKQKFVAADLAILQQGTALARPHTAPRRLHLRRTRDRRTLLHLRLHRHAQGRDALAPHALSARAFGINYFQ
jgi:translation initiation factor IF-2